MLIDSVIGNLNDLSDAEKKAKHHEKVYLESENLMKRIQRVKTDHGRDIGIRLKDPKDLEVGDILFMDEENIISIDVLSEKLIVIKPRDMQEMGFIAHQLGNRHLPAQFDTDVMLVQEDYLVIELLESLGIPFAIEDRKVKKAFRHIGHSHD